MYVSQNRLTAQKSFFIKKTTSDFVLFSWKSCNFAVDFAFEGLRQSKKGHENA